MRKGIYLGENPNLRDLDRQQLVAGVDGCTAGWLYVTARSSGPGVLALDRVALAPDFASLLDATSDCDAVAVDVPIGLSADGRRTADYAARALLGPRRSSVFPPPARFLLSMPGDYAQLNAASKAIRAGISRQTYNILAKIRDADRCMTPALQARVTESHPEVTFRAMNGNQPLAHSKKTAAGRAQRLALLERVYGPAAAPLTLPKGAAWDDLYDAAALTWTALRVANGIATHLPEQPERDARGLGMEIVY